MLTPSAVVVEYSLRRISPTTEVVLVQDAGILAVPISMSFCVPHPMRRAVLAPSKKMLASLIDVFIIDKMKR